MTVALFYCLSSFIQRDLKSKERRRKNLFACSVSIWLVVMVWPGWGWWCQCPGVLWCLQMSLVWLWGHFTASQPPPLTLVTANGWSFGWTLVWDKNKYLNKWINSRYLELCLPGSWGVTEYHYQLQRDQIVPTKWQYKLHYPMIFY